MTTRTVDDLPLLSGTTPRGDHRAEMERDPLGFLRRISTEEGDACAIKLLKRVLFVNSPELLHEVLVEKARSFEKSPVIRGVLKPFAGEGLFTARNDHWRPHRKLMAPLFQPGALARYAADMADCAVRGMAHWHDGEEVQMARETTRITMAIAGRTLFHAETFDEADELGAALTTALSWADRQSTALPYLSQIVAGNMMKNAAARAPAAVGNLLERAGQPRANIFNYASHAASDSMLNTPPTWNWYLLGLNLRWMLDEGGVAEFARRSARKSGALYAAIDGSGGFYRNEVAPAARSRMNVPFFLPDAELDARFVAESRAAGMIGLKGHKAVGGIRASLYNAVPVEAADALVGFMRDFQRRHG